MMAETVIEVRNLRNQFGRHVVHDGLDLDVYRGEILGVVGGSGTGKSVLLRSIAGLLTPKAGTVRMLGTEVRGASEAELDRLSHRIGVMFQDGALFSSLTVRENVEVPLRRVAGLTPETRAGLARLKIALSGLSVEAGEKYPAELSGGMRKRAGLARALALDPEILFLDEPTAGLDPIGAAAFDDLIRDLSQSLGLTVFLVTHDLDTLYAVCDRVAVLAEKRVLVAGPLEDMVDVDHPWVREYFLGPRARAARGARRRDEE
ncbi:ABC transporter ATP-binding protein [Tranquillimonas alkanivorans]|uniref:Phospholipid/cholesterol/gamma-HCH transport system ATP-binding protein n=1 Tax=Tranquillimonas alkanivorans TaxID=441119 RepID=A0A1I5Q517_9RHOB|nr:ABC transporter ATP-binding protein [Tranquillimonas alkanivorans]SFP41287.1 phospholipid/cholesterol/gamma-HCH transport system ATP-binding protein [Tranquillimonas alkanivorans]